MSMIKSSFLRSYANFNKNSIKYGRAVPGVVTIHCKPPNQGAQQYVSNFARETTPKRAVSATCAQAGSVNSPPKRTKTRQRKSAFSGAFQRKAAARHSARAGALSKRRLFHVAHDGDEARRNAGDRSQPDIYIYI